MRFVLVIEVEEDVTRKDLALALRRTASTLERTNDPLEHGDSGPIRSPDGEKVGDWEIL